MIRIGRSRSRCPTNAAVLADDPQVAIALVCSAPARLGKHSCRAAAPLPLRQAEQAPAADDSTRSQLVPGRSQLEVRSGLRTRRASDNLRAIVGEAVGIAQERELDRLF
jgi:hypothetical protein